VRHTGLDITVHSSGRQTQRGTPVPAGLAAAALGAVRGGPVRRPPRLAGSRLLPPRRRPARRQAGHPVGGPQDGPPRPPHPARPWRPGPRPRLNPRPESEGTRCAHLPTHRCPRPAPAHSAADRALVHASARKDRAAARPAGHPIDHHVAAAAPTWLCAPR
jgi:hypothetical protein